MSVRKGSLTYRIHMKLPDERISIMAQQHCGLMINNNMIIDAFTHGEAPESSEYWWYPTTVNGVVHI